MGQGGADGTHDSSIDAAVDGSVNTPRGGAGGTPSTAGGGTATHPDLPDASGGWDGSDHSVDVDADVDADIDADVDADADTAPECGDGNTDVALDEECDDGNQQHSDGCENDCTRTRITQVGLGWNLSCALSSGGGVKCWGQDVYGVLGRGTSGADLTPASPVPPLDFGTERRVVQISVGYSHVCVLFEDFKARCWGRNESGQLGHNSQVDYGDDELEQLSALGDLPLSNVQSITAGRFSTCAIVGTSGLEQLYCWGSNTRGELGINSVALHDQPGAATGLGSRPHASILGFRWACALLPSAARCWGGYQYGTQGTGPTSSNLGDNEYPNSASYDVQGLPAGAPTMISGTANTICALSGGQAYCWGRNLGGAAGYPIATYGEELWQTPRAVNLGTNSLVQISTGAIFSCAVDDEGFVRCWGNDPDDGALGYPGVGYVGADRDPVDEYQGMRSGDGGTSDAGTVTPGLPLGAVDLGDFDGTPGPDLATHVQVGADRTCAIMQTGNLRCWGENTAGILGYDISMEHIGLTESPAQAYEQLGQSDFQVFRPLP